jgi:hypothetical protein
MYVIHQSTETRFVIPVTIGAIGIVTKGLKIYLETTQEKRSIDEDKTFLDITPCSLVEVERCFRGAYCLDHQGGDGGRPVIRTRCSPVSRIMHTPTYSFRCTIIEKRAQGTRLKILYGLSIKKKGCHTNRRRRCRRENLTSLNPQIICSSPGNI